jgi:hypothetical protein
VLAARRHRRHPIKIIAALSSHLPADENKFAQLEKMRKILLKILPHAHGGFVGRARELAELCLLFSFIAPTAAAFLAAATRVLLFYHSMSEIRTNDLIINICKHHASFAAGF